MPKRKRTSSQSPGPDKQNSSVDHSRWPRPEKATDYLPLHETKTPIPKQHQIAVRASVKKQTKLSTDELVTLQASKATVPSLVLRGYSQERHGNYNRTKGYNDATTYIPAMSVNTPYDCHDDLADMWKEEVRFMTGNHLLWFDRDRDEFLSWTRSMLFVIEHVLGRSRKDQTGCFIAAIVPNRTATVKTATADAGKIPAFYWANKLMYAYDIYEWDGWSNLQQTGLHPRKFTHEILSHGVIHDPNPRYQHVALDDIIKLGLFKIYPEFEIPTNTQLSRVNKSTGLYERCSALRHSMFPRSSALVGSWAGSRLGGLPWEEDIYIKPENIPQEDINFAYEVAKLFVNRVEDSDTPKPTPPIHIMLKILALRRRPSQSPALRDFIRANFTAQDLQEHLYDAFCEVADNLPEIMQYIDLVRDVCTFLDMTPVGPKVIDGGPANPDARRTVGQRAHIRRYRREDEVLSPENGRLRTRLWGTYVAE